LWSVFFGTGIFGFTSRIPLLRNRGPKAKHERGFVYHTEHIGTSVGSYNGRPLWGRRGEIETTVASIVRAAACGHAIVGAERVVYRHSLTPPPPSATMDSNYSG